MRWALVAVVAVLLGAPAPASAVITQKLWPVPEHADPADSVESPLDLRAVGLGMRGTQLQLTIRTGGEWEAGALGREGVCVAMRGAGRLCVGAGGDGRTVVRHQRGSGAPRTLAADLDRPDRRSLVATVYPHALRLGFGRLQWSATTRWEGCAAPCTDRAPESGTFSTRVSALGGPRCFGAGARAGRRRCDDPDLRRVVIPAPGAAQVTPDLPCRRLRSRRYSVITPCAFGYPAGGTGPRVALIGDSHSAHWRAALDVAAKAAGWRAVSITSPGCSFSTEVYPAPAPTPARCRAHSREALAWLRRHRSVRTVVTSSSAGRGLSASGYVSMWSQVPRTVRRIFVIRDVPRVSFRTAGCVAAVRRRRQPSAGVCSVARGGAFPADTSFQAAGVGGRVRRLDFTRFFCSSARCYPVVGGAYVYRDFNHMNPVFNSTLGPYLLRAMRRRGV